MRRFMTCVGTLLLALAGCDKQHDAPTAVSTDSSSAAGEGRAVGVPSFEEVKAADMSRVSATCGKRSHSPGADSTNPLLAEWKGPYGGVPPFDRVKVADMKPALEAAMAENLCEIKIITRQHAPPSFENTIAAMERAGRTLQRVRAIYGVWSGSMSTPDFQAVETEMAPKLSAFDDQITQDEALFRRIEAVYNSPQKAKLTAEQQRLVWLYYNNFIRAGAKLDAQSKTRLSEINQQLASSYTKFAQNVLWDEANTFTVIENEADLDGLPQSVRDGAAAAATAKNMPGKWLIANTRSSVEPFLTYSTRRELRKQVFDLFITRGNMGGSTDNNATIPQILKLRVERAKLLGYASHAHWRLEDAMAKTPQGALDLLQKVWTPATARVKEEVADMQKIADQEGAGITIEPHDYRYYAEKVRKAKYDLNESEIKQYLQLNNLREGMFWVAGELFNLKFTPTTDVPVFHPDVRVWAVSDKVTGCHVGLWYNDPFARDGKQSGAWMDALRAQSRFDGEIPTIVTNTSNFIQGKPGEPVLISWDDATTLFHEFGHALHGLSSRVNYPSLSGTAVARDYVEFPSQLLEHWVPTPELLGKFALHYQTNQPIPQALVDRIKSAYTFNQGFMTTEYLASALVDMQMHLVVDREIDPKVFTKETLDALGMPKEIVMRHHPQHFLHIFAGDGYSAAYYSYLWADTITADAFEAFLEAPGGAYDKKVAQRLVTHVFSVGNTVDPAVGYRSFRGRDPTIDALMRDRGFPVPSGN